MIRRTCLLFLTAFLACSNFSIFAAPQTSEHASASGMSKADEAQFLLTAKVIKEGREGKGITSPYRLTLTDGQLTHEASFQPVNESKPMVQFPSGRTEFNFKDSFHFNIAGYQLAALLGLDDMVPVYVERRWKGMTGSMSWRIDDVAMDEGDRIKRKIDAPDPAAWNNQMYKIRVFNQLIYNTDPNLTNVLITKDWKIWLIDFTRAFRTNKKLEDPKDLVKCDRNLFEKLKGLDENQVLDATQKQLTKGEVKALMARRDAIVEFFEKEIATKGEGEVLY